MNRSRRTARRPADVPGLSVRSAAATMLDRVLVDGALLEETSGSGPDRAAARALADLTLRRLGQIDDVLARFVERTPKGAAQQILRLMAAELLFAGTAPHAAVDTAVRLARAEKRTARTSGLINAVGRRIAEQGASIVARQDAVALDMPAWLRRRLSRDWGAAAAEAMAVAHLQVPPHDLTLAVAADAAPLAAETGGEILPTGSLRLPGRPQISALPGYDQGAWWVQDAAAALPARLLGDVAGRQVLDLCAAPGGKTLQLAALGARVTALDLSEPRLARLEDNLARCGLAAETVAADLLEWQPGRLFDAVLLDAPCSASGTIRRHPDLPLRTDGSGVAGLARLQAQMLDRAAALVAPGGTLVYCTCSLFCEEGEMQVPDFIERSSGFARSPVSEADGIPPEFVTPDGNMRTRPDQWAERGGLDGFFAARFVRQL
jgi:16S rRNA (cytosine967-C5)-methyltransferase